MQSFNLQIIPNNFFTSNTKNVLVSVLSKININVCYGYIFLGYPQWEGETTDIFQYLGKDFLKSIKNQQTILIVDYTYEGFSKYECPIIKILENNCSMYGIDPKRIFYFSGNLHDISNQINVIPIFILDDKPSYRQDLNLNNKNLETTKKMCEENLHDKIFLSLSRRNRYHRVIGHSMLGNSNIFNFGIISQDRIKKFTIDPATMERMGINEKTFKRFKKSLPLIADKDQFDINDPFNILEELHTSTVFSIVNETLVNDYNKTSLFYSEKILKPIINFQPMIIYGQPGINHSLTKLGFKTYHDYFDLTFDFEPDTVGRYKGLLSSISQLVLTLSSMSKEERINWRFKHQEILKYNYQVFLDTVHSKKQSELFAALVKELD